METPLSGAANGLAQLVLQKWFTAMGFLGLLLFATTFVIETPADPAVTRCVALIMFGWGFGLTECRTFKSRGEGRFLITAPHWRFTVNGVIMFAIAIGAAIWLARITLL